MTRNPLSMTRGAAYSAWLRLNQATATHLQLPRCLQNQKLERALFLAGIARSGTTWLARMVMSEGSSYYIHEPFNPDYCTAFHEWDAVRGRAYADPKTDAFVDSLNKGALFSIYSMAYQSPRRYRGADKLLIKDVETMFSMEYLSRWPFTFIILLRDPRAYAHSVCRRNLAPNPYRVLERMHDARADSTVFPSLLDGVDLTERSSSPFFRAGLYWSLSYTCALRSLGTHSPLVLKYEDLVTDPRARLAAAFATLKLTWNDRVQKTLDQSMSPRFETYTRRRRDGGNEPWKEALSEEQAAEVLEGVHTLGDTVFPDYYSC